MSQAIEAAVLAAEQSRCAAMRANSADALALALDPRLNFVHSTGNVDDRDAFLAKVASGRIVYIDIGWPEQKVIVLSDSAAILTGNMVMDVKVEGVPKRLNNQVTTVWAKSGEAWLLASFQSTPLPA